MKFQILFAFIIIGFSSCAHKYYYPMSNNVPTHDGKHELSVNGNLNVGEDINAYEVQLAYSITDHIGLMGNFAYANAKIQQAQDHGNGYISDIGVGYFTKNNNFYASIYGGVGLSGQNHNYFITDTKTESIRVNYFNGFVQPALGLSTNYFEALLSVRMSLLNYGNVNNTLDPALQPESYNGLNVLNEHNPFIVFQPALTLRGGLPNLKLQTQLGLTRELNNRQIYFDGYFSLGLVYIHGRK